MRVIDLPKLLKKRYRWGNRDELWKNPTLQSDFREFSHNKCWYTEVKLAGHDAPVDHYRPKAEIKPYENYNYNKPLQSQGYYWLRRDPNNYRLSCTYANRKTGEGGKGCFFPLADDSEYLTPNGTETETPLLLDPCNADDVKLISFLGNEVVAASTNEHEKTRVKVSAEIYNLRDPYIKAERGKVWDEVEKTLAEYESRDISKDACIRRLKLYSSRESQFSACAIACINSLAPDDIIAELDLKL